MASEAPAPVVCGKIFWQGEGDRHHLCDDHASMVPAFGPLPGKWCLSPLPENLAAHDLTDAVNYVAKAITASELLPKKATRDAVHIAVSSVHGVDILLTWNCQHIANAAIMKELGGVVLRCGRELPILCTPEELPGE
jgi:hypothetical protein